MDFIARFRKRKSRLPGPADGASAWLDPRLPRAPWPQTVVLWSCPAYDPEGRKILASGLYDVVAHEARDESAGVPFWLLLPSGEEDDGENGVAVDDSAFAEQVWPKAFGRRLEEEREMEEFAEVLR